MSNEDDVKKNGAEDVSSDNLQDGAVIASENLEKNNIEKQPKTLEISEDSELGNALDVKAIPYSRFQKVNEEKKLYKQQTTKLEKQIEELKLELNSKIANVQEDDYVVDEALAKTAGVKKLESQIISLNKQIKTLQDMQSDVNKNLTATDKRNQINSIKQQAERLVDKTKNDDYVFNPEKYPEQISVVDSYLALKNEDGSRQFNVEEAFRVAVSLGKIKPVKSLKEKITKKVISESLVKPDNNNRAFLGGKMSEDKLENAILSAIAETKFQEE